MDIFFGWQDSSLHCFQYQYSIAVVFFYHRLDQVNIFWKASSKEIDSIYRIGLLYPLVKNEGVHLSNKKIPASMMHSDASCRQDSLNPLPTTRGHAATSLLSNPRARRVAWNVIVPWPNEWQKRVHVLGLKVPAFQPRRIWPEQQVETSETKQFANVHQPMPTTNHLTIWYEKKVSVRETCLKTSQNRTKQQSVLLWELPSVEKPPLGYHISRWSRSTWEFEGSWCDLVWPSHSPPFHPWDDSPWTISPHWDVQLIPRPPHDFLVSQVPRVHWQPRQSCHRCRSRCPPHLSRSSIPPARRWSAAKQWREDHQPQEHPQKPVEEWLLHL